MFFKWLLARYINITTYLTAEYWKKAQHPWRWNAYFIIWLASFYIIKHVISHGKTRQITRQTASNHFTFNYQPCHHPQITPKPIPPFPWLITPLPLRGTIGRCSWSLRNEESKGLGVGLCLPYTISPLIINHATPTIISPRNCVGIALLSQWMNFAI